MANRINTPADLLKAPVLPEDLRKILSSGIYSFTPEDDDGAAAEEVAARFDVTCIDLPPDLSDSDISLIWNVLGTFERSDCLDLEVYRSDRGNCIVDLLIACGGPTVRARYESRTERLTVSGSWGSSRLMLESSRDDFEGTPLAELIDAASAE